MTRRSVDHGFHPPQPGKENFPNDPIRESTPRHVPPTRHIGGNSDLVVPSRGIRASDTVRSDWPIGRSADYRGGVMTINGTLHLERSGIGIHSSGLPCSITCVFPLSRRVRRLALNRLEHVGLRRANLLFIGRRTHRALQALRLAGLT